MSVWKGAIQFGLIYIPIKLETAEEDRPLSFKYLDKRDISPTGYLRYNKNTGEEVDRENLVRAYEYSKDEYVLMEEEDFEEAAAESSKNIEIQDFVKMEELDPLLFQKPYYIVPEKNAEKGYHLLRQALEKTNTIAVANFVLRKKAHLTAIIQRDDYLILELLRYPHQVIETQEAEFLTQKQLKTKISQTESKMATQLVESMKTDWEPDKYRDTYYERMMEIIEDKAVHGRPARGKKKKKTKVHKGNVVDLVPLLKKSLKESREGEQRARAKKAKKTVRKTRKKKAS